MSRWTIPFSWAAASPSATSRAMSSARRGEERAVRHGQPERLALEELADGEPEAALVADVEEREDVGMREGGDGLRLGREARERLGVAGQLLGQDLDRDLAVQPRVPRAVDLAHAAGAERGDDLVRAEPGSCRKTHCGAGRF